MTHERFHVVSVQSESLELLRGILCTAEGRQTEGSTDGQTEMEGGREHDTAIQETDLHRVKNLPATRTCTLGSTCFDKYRNRCSWPLTVADALLRRRRRRLSSRRQYRFVIRVEIAEINRQLASELIIFNSVHVGQLRVRKAKASMCWLPRASVSFSL